jgi:hypothetical protein
MNSLTYQLHERILEKLNEWEIRKETIRLPVFPKGSFASVLLGKFYHLICAFNVIKHRQRDPIQPMLWVRAF